MQKPRQIIKENFARLRWILSMINSYEEWTQMYQRLVFWELELEDVDDSGMFEILTAQKTEANQQFCKFIDRNYADWFDDKNEDTPTLSHQLFKNKVVPLLKEKEPVLFVVVDNLRYDQFKVFENIINNHYKKVQEETYCSILPTATQYARNAIFLRLNACRYGKKTS